MREKGIEIIQNDSNVLVGRGEVTDLDFSIDSLAEGFIDKRELESISNPAYKKQWLCARKLASECSNLLDNPNVYLNKSETGRPFLKDSEIHISLSHNPFSTAVIFSTGACGIDTEVVRKKILRVEHKFMDESEMDRFSGDLEKSTLIWSAKESLYKMLNTPGVIFKDELHTKYITKRYLEIEISLKGGFRKVVRLPFRVFDGQVLTYVSLTDTVK